MSVRNVSRAVSFSSRRHVLVASAALVAGAVLTPGVTAQPYPNRPITMIAPIGPGSPQDALLRAMADVMTKELGQPIVVENKAGAATTLGPAVMAANAKPDGYTVSAVFTPLVLVPQMQKVAFDPSKDFTYILQVATFPLGIAIKADSPHKTWLDVVDFAKSNPGKISYGTPGTGSLPHLGLELVARQAAVELTHVPHSGTNLLIPAVLGGHVTLQASGMEWKPHVQQGSMRLLAMFTAQRHPSFPDVPTLRELGFPFDVEAQMGIVGPKGVDPTVTKRLHDAYKAAIETPAVQALYKKFDIDHRYANGEEFRSSLLANGARMTPVLKQLNLQAK